MPGGARGEGEGVSGEVPPVLPPFRDGTKTPHPHYGCGEGCYLASGEGVEGVTWLGGF